MQAGTRTTTNDIQTSRHTTTTQVHSHSATMLAFPSVTSTAQASHYMKRARSRRARRAATRSSVHSATTEQNQSEAPLTTGGRSRRDVAPTESLRLPRSTSHAEMSTRPVFHHLLRTRRRAHECAVRAMSWNWAHRGNTTHSLAVRSGF